MNESYLPLLAFTAGAAIAAQASLNAQLGQLLQSALLATTIAFASSLVFITLTLFTFYTKLPSIETFKGLPTYLWFSGGILSAFAIASFYWLIPKMGIGPMMSYALSGQLLFAILAGHFGWFQLPVISLSPLKLTGIFSLILGIVLINNG